MSKKRKLVPLISSRAAGPLGVLHLPRLWQKASLDARKKLATGYPAAGDGFDKMVIEGLGLNRSSFLAFIKLTKPTYAVLEEWIKVQQGVKLDQDSIAKLNDSIRAYNHGDATRKAIFDLCGLTDDTCSIRDAISLNELDDWHAFWKSEVYVRAKKAPPTAPTETSAGAAAGTMKAAPAPAGENAAEETAAAEEAKGGVTSQVASDVVEQVAASGNGNGSANAETEKTAVQQELPEDSTGCGHIAAPAPETTPVVSHAAESPTETATGTTQEAAPVAAE